MRVISGSARGRMLDAVPGKNTRPTTDKVKESVFNILQFRLYDAAMLDLFAGTGQMGIEALSRGAARAVFVDQAPKAIGVIKKNIAAARVEDRAEVLHMTYQQALQRLAGQQFDVLFLDVLMPGINGINAAREIRRYDTAVQIIFVTSSSEFAVQSYVVGAYYYQLKPIWKDSFFRLTDAVLAECRKRTQHSLILRCKSGVTRITLDSLEYCEVQGRTLVFHLLDGTVIEGELIPTLIDEIPIIAVLAATANGTTVIRNAEELKVKESNRLDIMVNELTAMGVSLEGTDDGMIIEGGKPFHGAQIDSRLDHRIAMSFAIASLAAETPTEILRAGCVDISYPTFYQDLARLQA